MKHEHLVYFTRN